MNPSTRIDIHRRRRSFIRAAGLAAILAPALHAPSIWAQDYPERPIRIVIPLSAGGNVTIVTRAIAQKMGEVLGQQFIIDNRPGGSGVIGAELVARAAPDGYTVLAAANTLVATPVMMRKAPYDPVRDFAGVSLLASLPHALVVHPSVPAHTVKAFIALARSRPGEMVHATQGEASTGRIAAELFTEKTGVKFLHVPYKGGGPAMIDLVGGQVSMMFATVSTALPHVSSGRIRALGVSSSRRSPAFPEVPTIAEAGVPGYEAIILNVMVAPAATPAGLRARLHTAVAKATGDSGLRSRFLTQGVELISSASAEECSTYLRGQFERHRELMTKLGLNAKQ